MEATWEWHRAGRRLDSQFGSDTKSSRECSFLFFTDRDIHFTGLCRFDVGIYDSFSRSLRASLDNTFSQLPDLQGLRYCTSVCLPRQPRKTAMRLPRTSQTSSTFGATQFTTSPATNSLSATESTKRIAQANSTMLVATPKLENSVTILYRLVLRRRS